jgi:hypothetical protein
MIDGWSETGHGHKPKPGDVSICVYCLTVLVFDAGCKPVLPPPERAAEIEALPDVRKVLKHLRADKLENAIPPPSKRGLMPRA